MASPRNALSPRSRAYRNPESRPISGRNVVMLPLEHEVPAPPHPPGVDFTREESKLWKQLWTSPVGYAWDEVECTSVAAYIRYNTMVMSGNGSAWCAQEARHLGDALGLTPRGRAALGWQIETGD